MRQLEGLEQKVEVLHGSVPERIEITESGIRYDVDPWHGQKTGLFLDQRENRAAAARYARGRLLDAFSYNGGFALTLASRCDEVVALDISADAVARIARNAQANGVSNVTAREANVFDELRHFERSGERFDTIVLDPPAFAKNKASVPNAIAGYKDINLRALRILQPGGTLITCSCSYNVDEALFFDILRDAAADAHAAVSVRRETHAGPRSSGSDGRAGDLLPEVRNSAGSWSDRLQLEATMGQDVHCIATWNGRRSVGTASLETDDIIFRGEFRLRIPFKTISDLTSEEGRLTVKIAEGTATFNLGVRAQQWAERIRNPKGVLDKLGIKPEMLVSVLGVSDQWFLDELTSRVDELRIGKVARSSDVIIAAINTPKELTLFETAAGELEEGRGDLGGPAEGRARGVGRQPS